MLSMIYCLAAVRKRGMHHSVATINVGVVIIHAELLVIQSITPSILMLRRQPSSQKIVL